MAPVPLSERLRLFRLKMRTLYVMFLLVTCRVNGQIRVTGVAPLLDMFYIKAGGTRCEIRAAG